MKKTIICLAIISLCSAHLTHAQEFEVGTNVINGGISFGGDFGSYRTSSQGLGFNVSYERGIWDVPGPGVVSLGGYLGTKSYKYDYIGGNDKWTYTIVGVRGAYHYTGLEIENLDVYGGVMAHYNILSFSGSGSYGSRASATPFIGGRWYFTENVGVFAEGSYGVAFFTLGVAFRI